MAEWTTEAAPEDGSIIQVRHIETYRWHPYSPKSEQFKKGRKGRWQCMDEYGGWENCTAPAGLEWRHEP